MIFSCYGPYKVLTRKTEKRVIDGHVLTGEPHLATFVPSPQLPNIYQYITNDIADAKEKKRIEDFLLRHEDCVKYDPKNELAIRTDIFYAVDLVGEIMGNVKHKDFLKYLGLIGLAAKTTLDDDDARLLTELQGRYPEFEEEGYGKEIEIPKASKAPLPKGRGRQVSGTKTTAHEPR